MPDVLDLLVNTAVVAAAIVVVLLTARLALTPRLAVLDFEGQTADLQKGLPRIVQSELEILRAEGGGTSLRFMTGPDKAIAVPEPVPNLPGFASVIQLVSLIPRRVHTVDGFLHADTPRGPALSVRLSRSELSDAATTIYLHDFVKPKPMVSEPRPSPPASPPSSDEGEPGAAETDDDNGGADKAPETRNPAGAYAYHRLAVAAAAWLAFRLPTRGVPGSVPEMLTTSWESYAHFRLGVEFQQAGDMASARRSFATSLMHDSLNRGSLLNLAGLDISTRCNGPAIDRLRLLCELLPDEELPRDRLWYRARFNLAVACLNDEDSAPTRLECATTYDLPARRAMAAAAIEEVIVRSEAALDHFEDAGPRAVRRTASPEFVTFLRTVHGMAVIVRADLAGRT